MNHYSKSGFKDFIIATGYKSKIIEKFFRKKILNWNVKIIYTGKNTMTGGRLKRLRKVVGNETFMMTYGDGVSNINLKKLIKFHKKNKKMITLTAVRPPARFGAIKINGHLVKHFKEKSKLDEGWINGGFFIMEPNFLNLIKHNQVYLEREPLEIICKRKQLAAFKHEGFWQCMDTKRDKELLENLYINNPEWLY